jgi:hypothetical protein
MLELLKNSTNSINDVHNVQPTNQSRDFSYLSRTLKLKRIFSRQLKLKRIFSGQLKLKITFFVAWRGEMFLNQFLAARKSRETLTNSRLGPAENIAFTMPTKSPKQLPS